MKHMLCFNWNLKRCLFWNSHAAEFGALDTKKEKEYFYITNFFLRIKYRNIPGLNDNKVNMTFSIILLSSVSKSSTNYNVYFF